jgi:CBS domain-containing protein
MICPDCGHDNIDGVDACEACGQPLVQFDDAGSELEQAITRHTVEVLAAKVPLTIPSSTSVRDAVNMLVDKKIGCLLVEDAGLLVGIFTERDVLYKVSGDWSLLDRPVAEFMTAPPVTITRQDSLAYALHAMDLGGYRHMPLVDEVGRPVGVISIRDILRFLCIRFAQLRSHAG